MRVLVTGASGRLGSHFARAASDRYALRLTDLPTADLSSLEAHGHVQPADLADADQAHALCDGIDTVVHLAASPDPSATWSTLLPANIIATYNIVTAAVANRCRRLVYASSIHAVSGYPPDVQVKTSEPVNPGDLYGVTKCFGEALGRYAAEQEGLSVIAVRIGMVQPVEAARERGLTPFLDAYVSEDDVQQLLERCVDVPDVQFAIVHGLSDNRFKRLDLSDTRRLTGFQPRHDAAVLNQTVPPELTERPTHSTRGSQQESGMREDLRRG